MKNTQFIAFKTDHNCFFWLLKENGTYSPLNEKALRRLIPEYANLNKKARQNRFIQFLEYSDCIKTAHIRTPLANAKRRISLHSEQPRYPDISDYKIGVTSLLQLADLFQTPQAGYTILADLLCGLRCENLWQAEPTFRPGVSIAAATSEMVDIFTAIINVIVRKDHWNGKHCKVKRLAILDYRGTDPLIGRQLGDFSEVKIKSKKGSVRTPAYYTDTTALIIGANSTQLREAAPYLQHATVFLLGCDAKDIAPTKLSGAQLSAYDPAVLATIQEQRERIAVTLHVWWAGDSSAWAKGIISQAKASFGRPDSRYVSVQLDPAKLRDAIRYRVILDFLREAEERNWLAHEDADRYRQSAKAVFDPEPSPEIVPRRAEEPETFLAIMSAFIAENNSQILPFDQPFVKTRKPTAALRRIGDKDYLVFLEEHWEKAYSNMARKSKVDCTFFQREHWARDMQKILCEGRVIKRPSAGFRYRYNLFENGKRDETYVVAIPLELLGNDLANTTAKILTARQNKLPAVLPKEEGETVAETLGAQGGEEP